MDGVLFMLSMYVHLNVPLVRTLFVCLCVSAWNRVCQCFCDLNYKKMLGIMACMGLAPTASNNNNNKGHVRMFFPELIYSE